MKQRSRGAYELERRGPHLREIASDVHVGKTTAGYWITGERRPSDAHVTRLSELYGVPPEAWDEPWPPKNAEPSTPEDPELESWIRGLVHDGGAILNGREDAIDFVAWILAVSLTARPGLFSEVIGGLAAKNPKGAKRLIADVLELLRPYVGHAAEAKASGT